ncbi:MAG: NAD nucleotidase [Treponema sp.]
MKKFKLPVLLLTAVIFAVSCAGTKPLANAGNQMPLEVTIIHINDHHSHLEPEKIDMMIGSKKTKTLIGGYPEAVNKIKSIKAAAKNPITLHAGDAITGTLYFTLFGGSADAALMNMTGFDYFTLGNHEFDAGNEGLKKFLDYLKVPVISANVNPEKKSILHGMWEPYAIMEFEGQKIGIIGLDTVRKTVDSSSPGKDVHFTDEVKTSQKYADKLKKKGINKIILLSHGGSEKNFEIAQKVSGIDIIITGDSHWLFGSGEMEKAGLPVRAQYPAKFMSPANEPVYVVEGWEYSKFVGELNVQFDGAGIVRSIKGKPHVLVHDTWFERRDDANKKYNPEGKEKDEIIAELNKMPFVSIAKADEEAAAILSQFKKEKETLGKEIVGSINGEVMPGGSPNRIPNSANPKGSIATRFVAETMLSEMRSLGSGNIDFTIQNSGGVRADINPGNVTFNDAYTFLPFGNTLFLVDVSGEETKQIIEDALEFALAGTSTGAFPYGAGIRFEANQYKDKNGKRLIKVEIQDRKTGAWELVDDKKMYKMGTNAYIAGGKDGYVTLGKVAKERNGEDTYLPDAESFIKFLKKNPGFTAYTESNVVLHFDPNNEVKK